MSEIYCHGTLLHLPRTNLVTNSKKSWMRVGRRRVPEEMILKSVKVRKEVNVSVKKEKVVMRCWVVREGRVYSGRWCVGWVRGRGWTRAHLGAERCSRRLPPPRGSGYLVTRRPSGTRIVDRSQSVVVKTPRHSHARHPSLTVRARARQLSITRGLPDSLRSAKCLQSLYSVTICFSACLSKMTEMAEEAFASHNYLLAVEIYERCLKQPGSNLEVLFGYADSLAKCGRIRESIDVFAQCFSLGPVPLEKLRHLVNAILEDVGGGCPRRRVPDSFGCPVCEGTLFQPVTGACGHTACRSCLEIGKNCRVCGHKIETVSEVNVLVQRLVEKWWPREAEASRVRHQADLLMKQGHVGQALERYNFAVHLGKFFAFVLWEWEMDE